MGNDKKNVQEVAKKSFLGQVRGFITTGASIVFEEIKYFLNPMNWGHSGRRVWHEVKQIVNQVLRKPTKEYFSRIETEPYSEYSIRIAEQGGGYVVIKASDIFTGKIQEMSDAQIKEVNALNDENTIFDIVIDRVAKKIIIEIDVYKIINDITDDPENKGKTEEEIKKLAIGKIIEAVDSATKGFAEINGGELKTHTDSTLLTGIGKTLYQPCKKQKDESKSPAENPTRPSEAVSKAASPNVNRTEESLHVTNLQDDTQQQKAQIEKAFSMTNPNDMLHQKSGKTQTQGNYEHVLSKDPEIVSNLSMPNAIKIDTNQAKTGAGMSNLLPTPGVNNNKTGPGIS